MVLYMVINGEGPAPCPIPASVSGMPIDEMLKILWNWLKLNNNSYKHDWKGPLPYGSYRRMRDDELTDQWLNATEM